MHFRIFMKTGVEVLQLGCATAFGLLVAGLVGCTSCEPMRVLKPTPQVATPFRLWAGESGHDLFLEGEQLSVWLQPCLGPRRGYEEGTVCARLKVAPGTTVRFARPDLIVSNLDGTEEKSWALPGITFGTNCSVPESSTEDCVPEARGISGPVQLKETQRFSYQGRKWKTYVATISTNVEFFGGVGEPPRVFDSLLHNPYSAPGIWYQFEVMKTPNLDAEKVLKLPTFLVNGRLVEFPPINLTPATGLRCVRPAV